MPCHPNRAVVDRYIQDVLSGKIIAGRLLILAVQRQVDDLNRSGPDWPYHFDEDKANRAIRFMESLKLSEGEFDGQPFILQPWQKFLVWVLFGWVDKDGLRRFHWAFISLGRGNGKSPLAAAILLYLTAADQPVEPKAQIKIAATERGTEDGGGAMIVFKACERFIRQSPALLKRFDILNRKLLYRPSESDIRPLGKEAKTKDGYNLHGFVADELHEWAKEHQPVWDKLETAMGKRRQPLGVSITTAGTDRSIIWRNEYRDAVNVLKGVYRDDRQFAFICQLDVEEPEEQLPGDDPLDISVYPKANPNWGISVKPDYIRRMIEKARANPLHLNKLKRYHGNILVRSRSKVIPMEAWRVVDAEPVPDLKGMHCHGGVDLGWKDDLMSFYLVFPLPENRFAVQGWSWTCDQNPHRDLDTEPYRSWIKQGRLIVTPGEITDHTAMMSKIKWAKKQFRIGSIALDTNNARTIEVELVNDLGLEVYAFGQTVKKYNEPLNRFVEAVTERRILHAGCPVLRWAASNMVVRTSQGLQMPDKDHSEDKIDPIVATLMGFSECLYSGSKEPIYNKRGLRSLSQ